MFSLPLRKIVSIDLLHRTVIIKSEHLFFLLQEIILQFALFSFSS